MATTTNPAETTAPRRRPGDVTYTASVYQDRDTGDIEVTIIRDVCAGVSGPCLSFRTAPRRPGMADITVEGMDIALTGRGYTRTSGWNITTSYLGMQLTATVEPA